MYIAFKVDGSVIEGELSGEFDSWKFTSYSAYFFEAFTKHSTDAAYFSQIYSVNNSQTGALNKRVSMMLY